jgi:hypothetical protein
MQEIASVLQAISQNTQATSVFLYGSRARGEELEGSDWELAALFKSKDFVPENDLCSIVAVPDDVRLYPYDHELFLRGEIVVPFQRALYLREIRMTGKTLVGETVVETFSPPPITLVDLLCDLKFYMGRASDALVSFRRHDVVTAASLLFKSCIFATRDWIIYNCRHFPATYREISEASVPGYSELIGKAYSMRAGATPDADLLLSNIYYINRFVEKQIEAEYRQGGDFTLIP